MSGEGLSGEFLSPSAKGMPQNEGSISAGNLSLSGSEVRYPSQLDNCFAVMGI
jgi:hypothetical protein